eukprot:scaffold4628_cov146-Skeletonema_dohrnii-CCMP3373.AAC.4
MTRKVKPAVGAGGKQKAKKKKTAEDDKREFNWKHHDHGDKAFHDKAHRQKPIVCVESKDDQIGADLAHLVEDEKKHHHHRHRVHREEDHRTVAY